MCSVAQGMEWVGNGRVTACELRRSIDESGYLNIFLIEDGTGSEWIIRNGQGDALNILDYDSALELAFDMGFSINNTKVNIR